MVGSRHDDKERRDMESGRIVLERSGRKGKGSKEAVSWAVIRDNTRDGKGGKDILFSEGLRKVGGSEGDSKSSNGCEKMNHS